MNSWRPGLWMQFDLTIVDPPPSSGEPLLATLLALGMLVGLVLAAARCFSGRAAQPDVAAWCAGIAGGAMLAAIRNEHVSLGALLLIVVFMFAGAWLAFRRDPEIRVLGMRVLEASSFAAASSILTSLYA